MHIFFLPSIFKPALINCEFLKMFKYILLPAHYQVLLYGIDIIFSNTQLVSVTVLITLCPVLSFSLTILLFRLLSSGCTDFFSNFVWKFLGWTPTKSVKTGVLPPFFVK